MIGRFGSISTADWIYPLAVFYLVRKRHHRLTESAEF